MDNPVREFADFVRYQFNVLRDFREIDNSYMGMTIEEITQITKGIGRRKGKGWTKQDVNIRRNLDLDWQDFDPAFPLAIKNVVYPKGRTSSRVSTAFRCFRPHSWMMKYRRAALNWVHENPDYMPVGAAVTWMSACHRRWLKLMEKNDYEVREEEEEWNATFSDLLEWIEEIEAEAEYEASLQPSQPQSLTPLLRKILSEIKTKRLKDIPWKQLYRAWGAPGSEPSDSAFEKALIRLRDALPKDEWQIEISESTRLVRVIKRPKI